MKDSHMCSLFSITELGMETQISPDSRRKDSPLHFIFLFDPSAIADQEAFDRGVDLGGGKQFPPKLRDLRLAAEGTGGVHRGRSQPVEYERREGFRGAAGKRCCEGFGWWEGEAEGDGLSGCGLRGEAEVVGWSGWGLQRKTLSSPLGFGGGGGQGPTPICAIAKRIALFGKEKNFSCNSLHMYLNYLFLRKKIVPSYLWPPKFKN